MTGPPRCRLVQTTSAREDAAGRHGLLKGPRSTSAEPGLDKGALRTLGPVSGTV